MSIFSGKGWIVACSGIFLTLILSGVGAQAQAPAQTEIENNDGPVGRASAGWDAQTYWAREDYAALDALFERLANPAEVLDDGQWRLSGISPGLADHFDVYQRWDQMLWQIGEWRAQNPRSAAVDIVEAIILKRWAWSARGNGYSSTVTPEGWKLFRQRMERAEAVLRNSKQRSSKNPLWYEEYLEVALGLDWDEAEFRALYKAAISQFPGYHPLYFSMERYLLPQWHGSVEAVDAYIGEVVKQTEPKQGKIMYARLYWALSGSQGTHFALFEDSAANWDDMRTGFRQMMQAFPDSQWNLNHFASFACRAGDSDTYRELRKKIGDRPYIDAWPDNLSIEVCDERLIKPI